jgi:hypothetical protein
MPADPPPPRPRKFNLKPKDDFARANAPDVAQHQSTDHDINTWHAQASRSGDAARPTPPLPLTHPDRRRRDYWLLMFLGNGGLAGLAAYGHLHGNAFLLGVGGAGIALYSLGITWLMWGVMDRY